MQHRLHIQPVWSYSRKPTSARARSRVLYALLAVAVVAGGLLWRSGLIPLPQWLSNHGGDALWALMVFVGFGFLLPRASTPVIALFALGTAWGVEFSQLSHAPWIDAIRATTPGKLVLGNTFVWTDLIAYAVGVALGAWAERGRQAARRVCARSVPVQYCPPADRHYFSCRSSPPECIRSSPATPTPP